MQLDKTDSEIIDILTAGYVPNSVIARKLGLTEGTVRQRIKKLKDNGAVNIKALRNPNVLDNQQLVIISATVTESRLLDTKAQEVSELDDVLSVSIVSGQYDLLIEVLVDSNKGLVRFLTESLSSIQGISKTESFVVLKSYNKYV